MDQETLHLHDTFHHGDAVKAANKDFEMAKKDKLKLLIAKTSKGVDEIVIDDWKIDLWEHSYYIGYRNRRAEFVDNLFPTVKWIT